jgi:hypothetical protein
MPGRPISELLKEQEQAQKQKKDSLIKVSDSWNTAINKVKTDIISSSSSKSTTLFENDLRQEKEQLWQTKEFIYISISFNFLLIAFFIYVIIEKLFKRNLFNFLSTFPEIENDFKKKKKILNELYYSRAFSKKEFKTKEKDLLQTTLKKIQVIKLKEALEENLVDEQEFDNLNKK